ncbi:MAG TPA: hypothetical protein H9895_08405 [Candidatus Pseudogracilibacillus intestinigallinarum]|uniref:Uncharacterized protein n=1 Tax=Candidatus Pseudogracilibacillus intestinigallinarum TaxID=2838742 RepID=A0A9D1PNJ2_9BACI|nr:hypothetical protein [Candidatus Pseudogracilibacillus intestinigallinarum]
MVNHEQYPNKWVQYLMNGIIYMERMMKVLLSLRPYMDQYGPLLQQLAVIYKAMKMIQEEGQNDHTFSNETNVHEPILYI